MQARVGSQHHPLAFRTPRRCLSSAAYTMEETYRSGESEVEVVMCLYYRWLV
jgi:hypothetical protein